MRIRLFVSIDIPDNMREKIQEIQKNLPRFKGKFTEEKNLHLTLKFLGEVDEEIIVEIRKKLSEIKFNKFKAGISELGVFSSENIRIIWLKIENCENLQKKIDKKLKEFFNEEKRFMGHLTIARVKSVKDKKQFLKELKKVKIPSELSFLVDNFYLKKSELNPKGPLHNRIEEYTLE